MRCKEASRQYIIIMFMGSFVSAKVPNCSLSIVNLSAIHCLSTVINYHISVGPDSLTKEGLIYLSSPCVLLVQETAAPDKCCKTWITPRTLN